MLSIKRGQTDWISQKRKENEAKNGKEKKYKEEGKWKKRRKRDELYSCSSEAIRVCAGGGSINPKFRMSWMPSAFSISTVLSVCSHMKTCVFHKNSKEREGERGNESEEERRRKNILRLARWISGTVLGSISL